MGFLGSPRSDSIRRALALLSSHEGVHHAYINALAQPWYVDTGAPLSSGAAIEFKGHPWHEA